MITVKILLNSVISTLNAKFMTIDIKDFYLNTPMARPEYMRLKLSDIPAAIIDLYKLRDIAQDGYVFVSFKRYVWTPTGRHHCTATPRTTPPGQRLPPKQTQPGFWTPIGDPSALPSVLISSEICGQSTRRASYQHSHGPLRHLH
eukprot:CCRYP_017080-RA/>CCRYP_017080-RA protein AED:0.44 eAED:0.44 QI:0/-1/0/1/-1/0/1/0/144